LPYGDGALAFRTDPTRVAQQRPEPVSHHSRVRSRRIVINLEEYFSHH
jgi:hypothetical protein